LSMQFLHLPRCLPPRQLRLSGVNPWFSQMSEMPVTRTSEWKLTLHVAASKIRTTFNDREAKA